MTYTTAHVICQMIPCKEICVKVLIETHSSYHLLAKTFGWTISFHTIMIDLEYQSAI